MHNKPHPRVLSLSGTFKLQHFCRRMSGFYLILEVFFEIQRPLRKSLHHKGFSGCYLEMPPFSELGKDANIEKNTSNHCLEIVWTLQFRCVSIFRRYCQEQSYHGSDWHFSIHARIFDNIACYSSANNVSCHSPCAKAAWSVFASRGRSRLPCPKKGAQAWQVCAS